MEVWLLFPAEAWMGDALSFSAPLPQDPWVVRAGRNFQSDKQQTNFKQGTAHVTSDHNSLLWQSLLGGREERLTVLGVGQGSTLSELFKEGPN